MEIALIASLAGIIGLVIGNLWDSRSEAARWQRDQRIRTYEQIGYTYYALREAFRVVAVSTPGTLQTDEAISRALDLGGEFNRAIFAVWLHGSEPVANTVRELNSRVNELFLASRAKQSSWEEWRVIRGPGEVALERFVEAVRSELSLPQISVAIRIEYPNGAIQESQTTES